MPVLLKQRWELFAQAICSNLQPAEAYVKAGFSDKGAAASATRLLKNAQICSRIAELQQKTVQIYVAGNISDRNYRLACLDEVSQIIRANLVNDEGKISGTMAREYREYLKQAAIEAGQWVEKRDVAVTTPANVPNFDGIDTETLTRARDLMAQAQQMLLEAPVAEMQAETVGERGQGAEGDGSEGVDDDATTAE